ncbi:MAG TPA: KamA family radical SAM protein [bacterium]|nr:KamA family radical SAM protein [bacterium]HQG45766.1 KamA family radical SAM protein [bacterium]HQI47649.1 KamA family radical SAM protein [bacterium]HQJ63255.1 KamA family radical SAM protein [bacterium]
MDDWQQLLRGSLTKPEEIAKRFDLNVEEVKKVAEVFKFRITPYYANLIKEKGDPIYRQIVPDAQELAENSGITDPLDEDHDSPVPSIVHRYPDRVLFLVSHSCASYCRFCTRKRKVGNSDKINPRHINAGLDYIRQHSEIRDVIVSGGDPLMLADSKLEYILSSLRSIKHIEIIRIGSRVPCFLPQRVTTALVNMLKKYHPLFINVHFNHPDEITEESARALNLLADAGIPLGNQTVLLKGVNDNPETMKRLMQKLLTVRVRPYYIYQADYVKGTEYLRTPVQKGLEIMQALRGWTSGLAVPAFVIDAPGGGGKIPLLPAYVQSIDDEKVVMRNYQGELFVYPQTSSGKAAKIPAAACKGPRSPVREAFPELEEIIC